jgi:hypothetical protein
MKYFSLNDSVLPQSAKGILPAEDERVRAIAQEPPKWPESQKKKMS